MIDRHVTILMALYNGKRFLQEQLDSIAVQTHTNWSLIGSDDGSTDATRDIFLAFAKAHPEHDICLVEGPRKGFAQNFLSLLTHVANNEVYVAFSDQDDIWLPEKLTRALEKLAPYQGQPALYAGRTITCDENGNRTGLSPLFKRPPSFQNALVQSIGGGNTMVMTAEACAFLQLGAPHARDIPAHDWWMYQVVSGIGGQVFYDSQPYLYYRQHDTNQIGSNSSHSARLKRFNGVIEGQFSIWISRNISALEELEKHFSSEHRKTFQLFKNGRRLFLFRRLKALYLAGIYRQTLLGSIALFIAVISNRV